jgi:thiamine kinase-like enzyme
MLKKTKKDNNGNIPQLLEMTDQYQLAEVLQQHVGAKLSEQGQKIHSCRVERIYYNPGGRCRLHLNAKICGKDGEELGHQIFFGGIFRPGEGKAVYEEARSREFQQPAFGDPIGFIPPWEMVVWAYPNDPRLDGLATMMSREKIFKLVSEQPSRFGIQNGYRPKDVQTRLAKYVPGKRCAYIFDFSLEDAAGEKKGHTLFGKAYYDDEVGSEAYTIMSKIWQTPACQRGAFAMPQPYWYDQELNIVWQEAIPGRALAKIAGEIDLAEIAKMIGSGLAAFHGSALIFPERMNLEFQLKELQSSLNAVSKTFPQYKDACSALYDKLKAAYPGLKPWPGRPVAPMPVHGSFKLSHIFYDGGKVAFIDFDGANLGDPCYDLGRFIAAVWKLQANSTIDRETAQRVIENFCCAYRQAGPAELPQQRIDWFASAHLLTSETYKAVKRLNSILVAELLKIADGICPPAQPNV